MLKIFMTNLTCHIHEKNIALCRKSNLEQRVLKSCYFGEQSNGLLWLVEVNQMNLLKGFTSCR